MAMLLRGAIYCLHALRVAKLFFRSESPGLVFSVTYLRGSFAPSAFSRKRELRLPPVISHEKTEASRQSLQKSLAPLMLLPVLRKLFPAASSNRSCQQGEIVDA